MPRRQTTASAYEHVRQQAVSALNKLRRDIRTVESELDALRKQEEQLLSITGGSAAPEPDGAPMSGRRMNWRAVLDQLPKRFTASDVRSVRGLADKASGEIFAAVTRWIDTGLVKRKERGVYERV